MLPLYTPVIWTKQLTESKQKSTPEEQEWKRQETSYVKTARKNNYWRRESSLQMANTWSDSQPAGEVTEGPNFQPSPPHSMEPVGPDKWGLYLSYLRVRLLLCISARNVWSGLRWKLCWLWLKFLGCTIRSIGFVPNCGTIYNACD